MPGREFCDEPRVLPCCHGLTNPPAAGERKFAWHLAGRLEVVVNGLARLLRQLEADWTPGLSLAHRRTGERVSVRGNVFDPHRPGGGARLPGTGPLRGHF